MVSFRCADFITFCEFVIFGYIVAKFDNITETILCISLITIWFLTETSKKLIRNFEAVSTYFAFVKETNQPVFKNSVS